MIEEWWVCPAYGRGGVVLGALCFQAPMGQRVCRDQAECSELLAGERVRIWEQIRRLAAAGDPVGIELAAVFEHPDQVLGGCAAADLDQADHFGRRPPGHEENPADPGLWVTIEGPADRDPA